MAEAKPYRRRPHAKAKRAFMEARYPGYYEAYDRGQATKKAKQKKNSTGRRQSTARRKRAPNAKVLVFKTKRAATAYAKSHGIPKSRYSLKRMKKAR